MRQLLGKNNQKKLLLGIRLPDLTPNQTQFKRFDPKVLGNGLGKFTEKELGRIVQLRGPIKI